ncbi:MAG: hypothetical protein VKK63_06775 [Synechococcus sp.]|nr:hypothetical protein [Synechococcus sp.]
MSRSLFRGATLLDSGPLEIRHIATRDRRDFGIYRLPGGESLENLLNP